MGPCLSCGQSYKHFTLVNYDSRVVPDLKLPPYYNPRVIIYERKMFLRLATGQRLPVYIFKRYFILSK